MYLQMCSCPARSISNLAKNYFVISVKATVIMIIITIIVIITIITIMIVVIIMIVIITSRRR